MPLGGGAHARTGSVLASVQRKLSRWAQWLTNWWVLSMVAAMLSAHAFAEEKSPGTQGWSGDLLDRLITVAPTDSERASEGEGGWLMKSYQLHALHVGDPGRATNLVNILRRMLPPESRLTEDRAANTLHLFTTAAGHEGAIEFISAMDAEEGSTTSHAESAAIPEEVRKALQTLAASNPDSEKLAKIVTDASRQMEQHVDEVLRHHQAEASLRARTLLFEFAGGVGVAFFAIALGIAWYLRRAHQREAQQAEQRQSAALAIPTRGLESLMAATHEQQDRAKELQRLMEGFSIAYQADRQRAGMLMETVARNHLEISTTIDQMRQLRRDIGENAGKLFLEINRDAIDAIVQRASDTLKNRAEEVGVIAETASRKMEETATRLEVQHTKAEALANELERTQKEVDALFEKLRGAQDDARRAQNEASEQRRIAAEKTAELAKREAALAGLSILMQEPMGQILETLEGSAPATANPEEDTSSDNLVEFAREDLAVAETDPAATPVQSENMDNTHNACPPNYRYRIIAAS